MMAVAKESGIRIAVVDDDMWVRTGRVSTLESAGLTVVMACDHDQALVGDDLWADVDVVLVDAWDASQEWDRFPGVRVVESVRRVRSSDETLIIVISGHVTNELLRLRMAEAGADFFYGHGELRNLDDLLQAIRSPNQARRARPHSNTKVAALGISSSAQLNAALHDIEDRGLQEAFRPRTSQKSLPFGRRALIATRRRVAGLARMTQPGPDGDRREPEWRHVVRLINLARGVNDVETE
jgi:DNA-binding response OmpR family regulator